MSSPSKEKNILGLYSNEIEYTESVEFGGRIKSYSKQELYNAQVRSKLIFYLENKILVKFRLIEPKGFYETKGLILNIYDDVVILEYDGLKIMQLLWEIDIHTIYPLGYNPIVEFIRKEIPEEIKIEVYKRANNLCQLKLEGCSNKAECIDHKIPISKGGQDNIENLQASCNNCNLKKSSKIIY